MDKIPNEHDPEWTLSRMNTITNGCLQPYTVYGYFDVVNC